MTGLKVLSDPFTLITMLIGIIILVQVVVNLFPVIMTNIVVLGNTNASAGGIGGNFTFSSLFASAGLVSIILSAVVLVSVLALIGIKTKGAGR